MIPKSYRTCVSCGSTVFEVGGFGLDSCTGCGLGTKGLIADTYGYIPTDRMFPTQLYTRRKRFKKYLQRANRSQSSNTIAPETWQYLLDRAPFRDAAHVHATLKAAKHLKRKCYDSIPLLCSHLCDMEVPSLTEPEMHLAMRHFDTIDAALRDVTMISYLYCLEYIFRKIGRDDMTAYINRIKCVKRRRAYRQRLDHIFEPDDIYTVADRLRDSTVPLHREVSTQGALAPDRAAGLQVGLLPGHEPGGGVGVGARRFGQIRLDEDLVEQQFGGALALHLLEPHKV